MNYYFPLRLKKLRLEKGLSQKELATKQEGSIPRTP